jgi:DNA-binding NarL/FixJ family response regulator
VASPTTRCSSGRREVAVRVLLVEDNDVYRSTLQLLLASHDGIDVVGGVASGADAAASCRELGADVVVMDFRLPGLDGAQATEAVRAACPRASVVCLTAEATEEDRHEVERAGAVALLEKGAPTRELVAAIVAAAGTVDG